MKTVTYTKLFTTGPVHVEVPFKDKKSAMFFLGEMQKIEDSSTSVIDSLSGRPYMVMNINLQ